MKDDLPDTRIPRPLKSLLQDIGLSGSAISPAQALGGVKLTSTVLQDFRPLTESLEWELSELYWAQAGLLPFVENDVPYLINNSGQLSEHVASLLFANCEECKPAGDIHVLELGSGTGLFARYFLTCFRNICEQEGKTYHTQLVYYVTDHSAKTVAQWLERGIFTDEHPMRVVLAKCDATQPLELFDASGARIKLDTLHAVICNYVLDVLPATILKQGANGAEELVIRTHLTEDRNLLAQYTNMTSGQIAEIATSADPKLRESLIPLISLLDFETHYAASKHPADLTAEVLSYDSKGERIIFNYGAMACLSACLGALSASGFILINDYGPTSKEDVSGHAMSQRFGSTSALGLNFPLLQHYLHARGCHMTIPEGDEARGIHARLLTKSTLAATNAAFHNRFGPSAPDFFDLPVEDARKHLAAGRKAEALECYRLALSRSPKAWQLVGEIAEFVGLQLQDFPSGLELIRSALEQNPWYSSWLWNVLGDILFLQQNVAAAHEAYVQAHCINPRDTRTNLNLAFTHFEFGAFDTALGSLAVALASDVRGIYRPRILEKQQQILGAISGRWIGEQERQAKRAERMLR